MKDKLHLNSRVELALAMAGVFLWLWARPAGAGQVSVYDDLGPPQNEVSVMVSTTPVLLQMTNDLNRTMVITNVDLDNPIMYGDSAVTVLSGTPIYPGEHLVLHGKTAGFKIYLAGSGLAKVVEYP